MELLRTLTLIYAGILVLALAVSLTAILVYLRRIASKLGTVHGHLSRVAERTAPLEGRFDAVDGNVARIEQASIETGAHFASAAHGAGFGVSKSREG